MFSLFHSLLLAHWLLTFGFCQQKWSHEIYLRRKWGGRTIWSKTMLQMESLTTTRVIHWLCSSFSWRWIRRVVFIQVQSRAEIWLKITTGFPIHIWLTKGVGTLKSTVERSGRSCISLVDSGDSHERYQKKKTPYMSTSKNQRNMTDFRNCRMLDLCPGRCYLLEWVHSILEVSF